MLYDPLALSTSLRFLSRLSTIDGPEDLEDIGVTDPVFVALNEVLLRTVVDLEAECGVFGVGGANVELDIGTSFCSWPAGSSSSSKMSWRFLLYASTKVTLLDVSPHKAMVMPTLQKWSELWWSL